MTSAEAARAGAKGPARAILVAATLLLAACGFRPVYLPESRDGSLAASESQAVFVAVIPDRTGQIFRQFLQQRLEGEGTDTPKRYELVAALGIGGEGIAILRDSSVTRVRFNGTATWTLRRLDPARTVLSGGTARITDGVNINNQQYVASDLEGDAATRRIAENLADRVALDVAIFLRKQAAAPQ